MSVKITIPAGYYVEETNDVVMSDDSLVHLHWLKLAALRHCDQLNELRFVATYRYEVEKVTKEMRERAGWSRWHRWAVVPFQNRLVKIDE